MRLRKTSTVDAWPDRIAATAWPTIAHGAAPPGPLSPMYVRSRMPRLWARSLPRTLSMSQRTMPSTSAAVRPASASAANDAWVAKLSSLRPDDREKSVAPMPAMAHWSRWEWSLTVGS